MIQLTGENRFGGGISARLGGCRHFVAVDLCTGGGGSSRGSALFSVQARRGCVDGELSGSSGELPFGSGSSFILYADTMEKRKDENFFFLVDFLRK